MGALFPRYIPGYIPGIVDIGAGSAPASEPPTPVEIADCDAATYLVVPVRIWGQWVYQCQQGTSERVFRFLADPEQDQTPWL